MLQKLQIILNEKSSNKSQRVKHIAQMYRIKLPLFKEHFFLSDASFSRYRRKILKCRRKGRILAPFLVSSALRLHYYMHCSVKFSGRLSRIKIITILDIPISVHISTGTYYIIILVPPIPTIYYANLPTNQPIVKKKNHCKKNIVKKKL